MIINYFDVVPFIIIFFSKKEEEIPLFKCAFGFKLKS